MDRGGRLNPFSIRNSLAFGENLIGFQSPVALRWR